MDDDVVPRVPAWEVSLRKPRMSVCYGPDNNADFQSEIRYQVSE